LILCRKVQAEPLPKVVPNKKRLLMITQRKVAKLVAGKARLEADPARAEVDLARERVLLDHLRVAAQRKEAHLRENLEARQQVENLAAEVPPKANL
jgi:hypothetical protein